MSHDAFLSIVGGMVALVVGFWAIITRRIAVGEDENSENNTWVYGWRAVAIGCAALSSALLFFASAAGFIQVNLGAG